IPNFATPRFTFYSFVIIYDTAKKIKPFSKKSFGNARFFYFPFNCKIFFVCAKMMRPKKDEKKTLM
ncbi:MAG TPA: hypothetical protein DDY98_07980, partial [Ruminococcaceae bacterium]|nr:hypothetical protein [Oscillospiraceae bacterium]